MFSPGAGSKDARRSSAETKGPPKKPLRSPFSCCVLFFNALLKAADPSYPTFRCSSLPRGGRAGDSPGEIFTQAKQGPY